MKNTLYLILIVLVTGVFTACEFEDFQVDPNRTVEATPGLVLTDLIVNSFNIVDVAPMLASRMMVYTDGLDLNQYYGWTRSGFGNYNQLRQVHQMTLEAERVGQTNYIALGKFFRAYHFYNLTMTFGDIPYREALGGFEEAFQPVYDPQETVFAGILADLEAANSELDDSQPALLGDVVFNGDLDRWRKAINSFRLRVLMTLSNKADESSIDVRGQFASILADPTTYPIMAGQRR